ncbi:MAG: hypothetical protein ACXWKH_20855, partial [Limisphaerales bacterium]
TLAVKRDGSVIAFGDNSCGQTNVPGDLTTATFVAAGSCFSLAAKNDGTVAGWGSTAPVLNLSNVISLATGRVHGLALTGTRAASLSISFQNGSANVGWSDASFQLQTTTNIFDAASWQIVLASTNAYTTNPSEAARFFRLIKN